MKSSNTESSDVAVFWDYENCHSSSQVSGYEVVNGIRNVAHRFGSVKHFKAYMEMPDPDTPRSLGLRSELQSSGVSLTDCPHNGRKNVADQMIIVDMMTYAMDHPAPATLVLISGDRDFAYLVSVLRLRRYEIVVISLSAHISLKSQASVCLDWNIDIMGYPLNSGQTLTGSYFGERPSPFSGPKAADHHAGKPLSTASFGSVSIHPSTSGPGKESPLCNSPGPRQGPEVCAPAPAYSPNIPQTPKKDVFGLAYPITPTPVTSNSPLQGSRSTEEPGHASSTVSGKPISPPIPPMLPSAERITPVRPLSSPIFLSSSPQASVQTLTPDAPPIAGPSRLVPAPAGGNPTQKTVPPAFKALFDALQKYKAKGINQPLRSIIGYELAGQAQTVYKEMGAKNFSQLTALAEQAKIVQLGGKDGKAWISLHRDWHSQ
ncbi:NYN domain-containing protein [Mycena maculata]|uniref:NYN domain-containing protein n=1 Tax=Mycena maculata TaxID=230809 RepID=A0AAD7IBH3_9AGAR|nr:NYN domain-containing protein [Mycena maculata]